VGKSAVSPIIVVRFHRSYYNDFGEMKLTALKMSLHARERGDNGKRRPRVGRLDLGALLGLAGVVAVFAGKDIGSRKGGKKESRDDFELHIVLFL